MKNKLYRKEKNKKSFASICLALLLTLTFNSTPILAVSNHLNKSANAYKSEQKYVYYPTTSTTTSDKFTANYPSGLTNYVSTSNNKFNLLEYYNSAFTPLFTKYADRFFAEYYVADKADYTDQVAAFLSEHFDAADTPTVSKFYELKKTEFPAQKTIRDFVEYFAMNDMQATDAANSVPKLCETKTEFYQRFFDFIYRQVDSKGTYGDFPADDGLTADTTNEQFYDKSVAYNKVKERLDSEIAKEVAIVSHDGTTQNVNVAAIIAKEAPTFLNYNYTDKAYTSYYKITTDANFVEKGVNNITKKEVFYFGQLINIANDPVYLANQAYFTTTVAKEDADLMYYYPITKTTDFGYIGTGNQQTYYKYTKNPYAQSNSKYLVYVLDDTPTTAELDTISSLHFNHITSEDLNSLKGIINGEEKSLYVQVPYENDELYFKSVYNNSLYNKNYSFEKFVELFAPSGVSKLYLKFNSTVTYKVYVDSTKLAAFNASYPTYPYIVEGVNINQHDYIKIESSSNYFRNDYELYFERTKEYFTETKTTYTSTHETVTDAEVNYKTGMFPATTYDGKLYGIALDGGDDATLTSKGIEVLTQDQLDEAKKYFVSAPVYRYEDTDLSEENYALYYKHAQVSKPILYVVDDNVDAKESAIYEALSFEIISTNYLKSEYVNFNPVAEGDANYNKHYNLYYRYDRAPITTQVYVLNDNDSISEEQLAIYTTKGYKVIKSSALADYTLIVEGDANYDAEFTLYYKTENVFVQNLLTGSNAIYIVDDNVTNTDKTSYGPKSYIPISSSELKDNATYYKLLGSYDTNYSTSNTKLYYKYLSSETPRKVVYTANDIDTNAAGFDKKVFELIPSTDTENYEAGVDKYYKRITTTTKTNITKNSTYYYVSPELSLAANSYYAISFYANTSINVEASVYLKDSSNVMSEIAIEKISTNGAWQQYYMFISTDSVSASKANLYFYLGDKTSIAGSKTGLLEYKLVATNTEYSKTTTYYTYDSANEKYNVYSYNAEDWDDGKLKSTTTLYVVPTVSGSALFNEIKVINIGVTDFNKKSIDEVKVQSTPLTEIPVGETEPVEVPNKYADEFNNELILVNALKDTDAQYNASNKFDYKTQAAVDMFDEDMFNFEDDTLQTILDSDALAKIDKNTTGYTMYENMTTLWRYYISRDSKIDYSIEQFRQAYNNGDLDVEITNIIEKTKVDEDEEEKTEEDKKDEKKDVVYVESPFQDENFALKLTNKNTNTALGVTSNRFTVRRMDYLKITVWVYSPDKDGKAKIDINSVQETKNEPTYGSLRNASISIDANTSAYTNAVVNEYGWMPVYLYVEGNALKDQDCYLVLSAGKDSTVYFDNIKIERITSALYDTASSDSDNKTCALSLSPSSSLISTGVTNGNFDLINVTNREVPNDNELKTAESWTAVGGNSKSVKAGIMSLKNTGYFAALSSSFATKPPVDGIDTFSNIYVINAPINHTAITGETISNYKSTYKMYSASISLSANSVYELSFKFYKTPEFNGTLVSNIYSNSKLTSEYYIMGMTLESSEIESGWQTYTYYIATSSSSTSVYLEIGVEDAYGASFFKSVSCIKSTKTYDAIKDQVYTDANITSSNTSNIYEVIKTARFVNFAEPQFSIHSNNSKDDSVAYDQSEFTHTLTNTNLYTVGSNGTVVAKYYDKESVTTYSVTIDKVTYYIGEVYEVVISDTTYYVHRTFNGTTNKYVYKLYSDAELTTELTKIGEDTFKINATASGVEVVMASTYASTKTSYRLFKYSDCTDEIKTISDKTVSVPSLDKVVLGAEEDDNSYTSAKETKNSYVYHFGTKDIELNNVVIPADELENTYSENVLILANSYSSDYQLITQKYKNSIAKGSFVAVRIYVKTSDFENDSIGLNIKINALSANWTNINTTDATNADKNGFVCYEVLVKTNSTDAVSNIAIDFSIGEATDKTSKTTAGYAIIAGVEFVSYPNAEEFNHYVEVAEQNETTIKKFYDEKATSTKTEDTEEADDKNSVSWATFFYIFSSLLLVLTMAIALVAVILKKHPIKFAKKYKNDHEKDIEIIKVKNSKEKDTIDELSNKNKDGIL